MTDQQNPPYAVQIELTEGCNLRCGFCGLSGIRGDDNDFRFMDQPTAHAIASGMAKHKWNSRVEFAMHGEPTMNPEITEIISIFREWLPKAKLMITSNGGGLAADAPARISALFSAGLDTLALDQYQGISLVPKIREQIYKACGVPTGGGVYTLDRFGHPDGFDIHVHEYPADKEGNPHQRKKTKRLVFIAPIDVSTTGTHATLNNHAGSGAPKDYSADGKRCAKPFRELSVRWDGKVAVCCNDWRGEYVIGSILDMSLDDLWNHIRFRAIRRLLYHGIRDTGPCHGCNAVSYRPGLLPDAKGKEDMAEPTFEALGPAWNKEFNAISEALSEGPLTEPVFREWETDAIIIDDPLNDGRLAPGQEAVEVWFNKAVADRQEKE